MYSNLDIYKNAQAIEIEPTLTWPHSLEYISGQLEQPTIVVGYSQGARLALGLAIEQPQNIEGLVLISGNAGIEDDSERQTRCENDIALAESAATDINNFWETFDANQVFDSPINNDSRINDGKILLNQLMNIGQGLMPNYNDRISEIKVPVLYCTGIRDKKYSAIAQIMKKKTAFAHHILFDSDHRVSFQTPKNLSLTIEWFANNVVDMNRA